MVTLLTSSKLVTRLSLSVSPIGADSNAVFGGLIVDIHGSAALHNDATNGFRDGHDLIIPIRPL